MKMPNCRTDECYNQKYLEESDRAWIYGYDYAVEQIISMIQWNTEIYPELDEILDYRKAVALVDKKGILCDSIKDWAEMQRNELITSIIDNMNDEEYDAIKEKVDGRSEKVDGRTAKRNGEDDSWYIQGIDR